MVKADGKINLVTEPNQQVLQNSNHALKSSPKEGVGISAAQKQGALEGSNFTFNVDNADGAEILQSAALAQIKEKPAKLESIVTNAAEADKEEN